ncbi:hypothetical protein CO009_02545 [Candidatus Shapirobacteria bacterium CG_4_8_14_3_um_filter_35_11]|uniref:Uncharacterized protein n=5 Tax=Candidatus Shapironibacteriota TaxID=1752721 RepID=A0A1J5I846_9BACT|nr:MAG: hypothetical protein AUK05_01425 [Candidatus Shapirobacteria bacterium CG2_30_35_20]PIV07507.1 MAG: hypothetical protein COS53_02055 [Candidatus Shapirobacteria bacterium CG03_land_8_20_14_0_80_35_14]PJA50750.1 MAG: hypothetical protein CO168_03385 [Candidatus Shapirobacteria bacterium CG_4_9_14_3_um_filter_36_12]PJC80217.1 MAG: hypothetical protein CO009_02545 [Candidatus Shapirobacteria bacterium CG_4_8_14_3_um_filter_35_11]PJE66698.1 MAG: hypothetical protein COU93_02910 [Candidatus 
MPNRILLTVTLSLFFFQLAFSIIYSNIIIKINQTFFEKNKVYTNLSSVNQNLELQYVQKYAINQQ